MLWEMPWASCGFGHPACAEGAHGPVGRPGVGRVHTALLFSLSFRRLPVENVILSLEAFALGSATRQIPLSEPACVTGGSAGPQLWSQVSPWLSGLQKGILQHGREFQPPPYLQTGQLMGSAWHFSIGEANTF